MPQMKIKPAAFQMYPAQITGTNNKPESCDRFLFAQSPLLLSAPDGIKEMSSVADTAASFLL